MAKFKISESVIIERLYRGLIISNGNSINYVNESLALFVELCQQNVDFNDYVLEKYAETINRLIELEVLTCQE